MIPKRIGIVHDSAELRKLIAENPDLPVVVACSDEDCIGDGVLTYMPKMTCHVAEILDAELGTMGDGFYKIYDDWNDVEETIREQLGEELDFYTNITDEVFEKEVSKRLDEYRKYWRKVILVRVANQ